MRALLIASLTSITGLTACGSPLGFNQASNDNRRSESFDARGEAPNPDSPKKAKRKAETSADKELLECPVIARHANMDACDDDDLAVQQQTTAREEAEISQNPDSKPTTDTKPVETSPPLPAPSPVPPPPAPPTPPTTMPPPPQDPNLIEFRIKAGTDKSPWNTAGETLTAKVGQTIRIFNDDTVTHRLHTNGTPCPHGQNIAPGASADCVLTRPHDPAVGGPLYDHIAGPAAAFYVKVTN